MKSSAEPRRARSGMPRRRPWRLVSALGVLLPAALLLGALPPAAEDTAAPRAGTPPAASEQPSGPDPLPSRDALDRDPAAAGLLLFDLLEEADAAEKSGDPQTALRAYAALARAVPERATAFSKLCELHRVVGERDAAIAACHRATGLPGSKVADHLRYVELLLGKPAGVAFEARELDELRSSFVHLRREGVTGPELEVLACQFAVVLEEIEPLQRCVERLRAALPPASPITTTYELSLALFQRDFERARAIVAQARQSGMRADSVELMEAELARRAEAAGAVRRPSLGGLLGGGLVVTALAVVGWFSRRRRPKAA